MKSDEVEAGLSLLCDGDDGGLVNAIGWGKKKVSLRLGDTLVSFISYSSSNMLEYFIHINLSLLFILCSSTR